MAENTAIDKDSTTDFYDEEVEEDVPLEKRKKMFQKELRCMMYGFGDDRNSYTESVDLLEDVIIEYMTDMMPENDRQKRYCCLWKADDIVTIAVGGGSLCVDKQTKKAMEIGRVGRIAVEDIIFLIRKDPKKYSRVKELLLMNEELRKARKAFDEIKYANTK